MKLSPWLLFLLAVAAVALLIWLGVTSGRPVEDAPRDQHMDSSATVRRMDSTALATADTVLAREARRDTAEWAKDSAYAKLARRNDSLDLVVARIRRANNSRRDSLNALRLEPSEPVDTTFLDTATVIAGQDSSLSCESRYTARLEQLNLLGQALDRCRARGDTVRSTLIGVRDQLALSKTYLAASDSLLAWEVTRPRPCRVNLVVAHVSCGAMVGGSAVAGFVLGLVARR